MVAPNYSPFLTARIRLTLWYMLISYVLLAVTTFAAIMTERQAFAAVEQTVHSNVRGVVFNIYLQQQIDQFSSHFAQRLILFDVVVFILATIASYFLSGRTLKPIEAMVKEQEQFAADASHELRTPLSNIAMEIEAHRRTKHKIDPEDAELLSSIQSEVERMRAMVAGLLSLVRQNGPNNRITETVNISALCHEVMESMQARFAQKRQRAEAIIAPDLLVEGQADELRQIMLILLDNAVKYTPKSGQIELRLSSAVREGQPLVTLVVHNTGSVISANEQQRIFDRFYRGKNSQESGTGLGLAIAKSLVERHHGQIAVASSQEFGTSFRVELPAAAHSLPAVSDNV